MLIATSLTLVAAAPAPRLPRTLRRAPGVAAALCLLVVPSGGQRGARRNAWAGISADAARRAARCEAEAAMAVAVERAHPGLRSGTA